MALFETKKKKNHKQRKKSAGGCSSALNLISVEKLKFRVVNDDGLSGGGDRRQRDGGSEYSHFIHRRNDRKVAVVPRC